MDNGYITTFSNQSTQNYTSLIVSILMIVAIWKIFEKAGESGWKSLIPFYNDYILCKIANCKNLFFARLIANIVMMITMVPMMILFLGIAMFGSEASLAGIGIGFLMALVIFLLSILVSFVLSIFININLAKAFGLSGGFAVGLILLPVIFYLIMAFSSNIQYNGYQENDYQNDNL